MLFNRTIHDNIALATPGMSREAVIRMAKLSGAEEFICKLPRGYGTLIEERGANLWRTAATTGHCPRSF